MNEPFALALKEYNDAFRLFDYAVTPLETDVAIALIYSAEIKIKALKSVPYYANELQPISEVY
jgi:hypothetical protein